MYGLIRSIHNVFHMTTHEALKSFANQKLQHGESLNDCLNRFITAKSVLWGHVGKDFTKMLQTDKKYQDAKTRNQGELLSLRCMALANRIFLLANG